MTDLQYLPGVGPRRAELLSEELHIRTAEELIGYFPYKYIDKSHIYRVCDIDGNMPYILLRGHVSTFEEMGVGPSKRLVGHFTDGTGWVDCVWFKGLKYVVNNVDKGREYLLFGKPSEFQNVYNIPHPELEPSVDEATDGEKQGLSGLYNTSEKMKRMMLTSKALQRIILAFFKRNPGPLPETLPAYITEQMHLMQYNTAIRQIHFPANPDNLRQAQYRFKFEELFYLELYLVRNSKLRQRDLAGFPFARIADYFNNFYRQCLPFELTGAQKRVLKEIRADVGSGRQMNRLLQGDVGSGKTLVAVLTMLMALDNGFQACLMAPTEILATQHYENLLEQLTSVGVHVALLTGSTPKKQREKIYAALADGSLHILIGTHALIEPTVQFKNLGMVVIDEQHRFGVKQRSLLWQKNIRPPHVLVMTATPIPRTLAMTVYGDLEVSVIDELPPGRKPIQTLHRFDNQRLGLNQAVRSQLLQGRQAYVVYPLIEENEKLAYRNVEEGFRVMQEAFPEYKVVMVHGKMKAKEKEEAMQKFVKNEAQIMVATTVIEVGVNVPNASVMIIESAERFGLSQLHQLRGRVGRGADQSYCVLVTNYKMSDDTRKRMEIMCATTDGFEIAEADLKMRGPGDLEGTQQSGLAFDLRIANLARDGQILTQAREMAMAVIDRDPLLEAAGNHILRQQLDKRFAHTVDWSRIS
jgi:ATP-dependent DNA helicase RecG